MHQILKIVLISYHPQEYNDDELFRHHIESPGDLRRIYCRICSNQSPR